ncbi:eukaryotic translation initiation factor 3 subunit C [Neocloeon triangulifer]|uniref:eukaryotic translation initiation factor 3 subunit C n=1 Tax=Neocloeon triangulifer TaxID=2078957 RepID=UPI00286F430B|nr:eukaryotic translation initiation factor 3 subunit C [Neocloeon triangulifer]XP_059474550.1 eukaryotic translation initiation factor 3 subunit C [Neocloeon triangulifer]XP_059474551.1 eukaryotic translation initiation factor 3 subunit C [Neocloeon triangulifer]
MSRFFATGSDSESESSSEEEQIQRQPAAGFTFSDDEEEAKRVVRSTKEKRYEELTNLIKQIRNHKKIKDMSSMLSSFEELTRAYQKALPVVTKEENGVTPRFYVRILAELDAFINEVWEDKEGRKNMSKNNSKSLASMRQKLRKYSKDFEKDLALFKEAPDGGDDDDEADKDEEVESDDSDAKPTAKKSTLKQEPEKFAKRGGGEEDESEDSMDWGSDSETSSSESEEDAYMNIRDRFLKKTTEKEEEETKKEKKERREREHRKKREEEDDEGGWETVKGGVAIPSEKPKMFAKDADIDIHIVVRKLGEIMAARGKKRTDRREQIELLHELQGIAEQHSLGPAIHLKIKLAIIAAIFDYTPKVSDAMKPEYWTKLLDRIPDALDVLLAQPDLRVADDILEENEQFEEAPYQIRGCVLTVVERLDEEFVKLLKECDPHSNEYVLRLKDELKVVQIIDQVQTYIERQNKPADVCRIYLRKIEHLYYKLDTRAIERKEGKLPSDTVTNVEVMEQLCKYVYAKDNTDRLRTRAILCHIYHHALHDNWFEARDLVLMSHLQETIQHSDPSTQILYNRTMAHLGLCAFRHANIKDSHSCLVDLMMTGKVKELLAQGLLPQRQHERSKEQEKIEKQRQMPFHMHINQELLECVYLVSAMLIEIPYMAAHEFDARRRMISKTFYQQLRSSERQSLLGPPESMREHVVAASKAMRNGNWNACFNFIINDKMNAKVWDLFAQAEKVRVMLKQLIQEESLRTYLFTYSNVYDSISMEKLSRMFELEKAVVHSVISKMIINEELMASLDDPSQSVVMHRSEPSRLQSIALQLVDKVNNLVDSNERIFEMKQGNFFVRGGGGGGGGGQGGNFRDRQNYNRQERGQDWGRQRNRGGGDRDSHRDNRAY